MGYNFLMFNSLYMALYRLAHCLKHLLGHIHRNTTQLCIRLCECSACTRPHPLSHSLALPLSLPPSLYLPLPRPSPFVPPPPHLSTHVSECRSIIHWPASLPLHLPVRTSRNRPSPATSPGPCWWNSTHNTCYARYQNYKCFLVCSPISTAGNQTGSTQVRRQVRES